MAKIFLYIVAGIIILVIGGAVILMAFQEELTEWALVPPEAFENYDAPVAPDYADPASWAALPGKSDNADRTPPGISDNQENAEADVFFVPPTTYYSRNSWNADILDAESRERVDRFSMQYQASAFNECCRVYAPYYRQATLGAFFSEDTASGQKALDLAYGDVRAAFRHYIETDNQDRSFILAGHSQGSRHIARLLHDEIEGTPLADRLIAVYPVGYVIPESFFGAYYPSVGICRTPDETRCLATWNTWSAGGDTSEFGVGPGLWHDSSPGVYEPPFACVNPLNWTADGARAEPSRNLGALPLITESVETPALEKDVAGAQCRGGVLYVSVKETDGFEGLVLPNGNYHAYDYNLFWMNIRVNADLRTKAFLQSDTQQHNGL